MNINPVVKIPDNVFLTIKYSMFPVFFFVLFFAGLKDAPIEIIIMIIAMLAAIEFSFIPYDIGKLIEDETHPFAYQVRPSIVAINLLAELVKSSRVTKFYSKSSLFVAKFFKVFPFILLFGIFPYILLSVR